MYTKDPYNKIFYQTHKDTDIHSIYIYAMT